MIVQTKKLKKKKFNTRIYFLTAAISLFIAVLLIVWVLKLHFSSSENQQKIAEGVELSSKVQGISDNTIAILNILASAIEDSGSIDQANERIKKFNQQFTEIIIVAEEKNPNIKVWGDSLRDKIQFIENCLDNPFDTLKYSKKAELIHSAIMAYLDIQRLSKQILSEIRKKTQQVSFDIAKEWDSLRIIAVIAAVYGIIFCVITFVLALSIKKRKETTEKWEEISYRYAKLLDQLPDIVLIHRGGIIEYINEIGEHATGYDSSELIGTNVMEHTYPEDIPIVKKAIEERLKGNKVEDYEVRLLTKNKELRYVIVRGDIISFDDENPTFLVILIDITERKKIELRLKESEERYRMLFDLSPTGLIIEDLNGKILDVNEAICKSLQYSPEEMLRMRVHDLAPPEMYHKVEENLKRLQNGEIVRQEVQNLRKDGTLCDFEITERMITLSDGRKVIMVLSSDISERRKAEQQIIKYLADLKELNATKDKFFSIIAHDLRTPFTVFSSFAGILKRDIDEMSKDEIYRLIEEFEKSVSKTFLLLENLLMWSRVQSGTIKFNPQSFSVHTEISDILSVYQSKAKEKEIALSAGEQQCDCTVFADKDMFNTVIRNLVSNAIKYTRKGGKINISQTCNEKDVVICVEDNGVGIKPENIEKLFRIDIHFSTQGTAEETGSGLGLILCKEFVEKNSGKIWVESKLGLGSKFYVSIPRHPNNP